MSEPNRPTVQALRLKCFICGTAECSACASLRHEAADEIERLTRELSDSKAEKAGVRAAFDFHAERRDKQLAAARQRIETLEAENSRLIDGVRYWSYCMSQGMRAECPEKVEQLMDFLISCKIAPYYMPMGGEL